MTTWRNEGFAAGLFKLSGSFLPPPPEGVQPPPLWGVESHVKDIFAAAGATPDIARETLDLEFASEQDAVDDYTTNFGPFVTARIVLEPQGRWPEFVKALADLVRRFNRGTGGTARILRYFRPSRDDAMSTAADSSLPARVPSFAIL